MKGLSPVATAPVASEEGRPEDGVQYDVYGPAAARLWLQYWRIFFIACEETFALDSGQAYFVGHYLFSRKDV